MSQTRKSRPKAVMNVSMRRHYMVLYQLHDKRPASQGQSRGDYQADERVMEPH